MSKHVKACGLYACCCLAALMAGCFPEDSLDWSGDGSVGLLRNDSGLYLVDGASGALTRVCEGEVFPWPSLSSDGAQIVYGRQISFARLDDGLEALPAVEVAMIENDARRLRDRILSDTFDTSQFKWNGEHVFGYGDAYRSWLARYVCERGDERVVRKLGIELTEEGKAFDLSASRLVIVTRDDLDHKTAITTSMLPILRPRLSPDSRHVAYIVPDMHDEEKATLYVAPAAAKSTPVEVRAGVAISYDWRPDSRALAYVKQDGDGLLGVVEETTVVDEAGTLLAELAATPASAPVGIQRCTGPRSQPVGTLFQSLMKVQYGRNGRLFFSSPAGKIPTSDLEEPTYSLFCYDFTTGTVVDVLPASVSSLAGEMVNFFALSPDGMKVLLPMEKHRFAVYTLSDKTPVVPIEEDEEFGDEIPDMLPSWKSNTEISCLVSGSSRFLGDNAQEQEDRHEIVVLNVDGSFQTHLSGDWSDDVMP